MIEIMLSTILSEDIGLWEVCELVVITMETSEEYTCIRSEIMLMLFIFCINYSLPEVKIGGTFPVYKNYQG